MQKMSTLLRRGKRKEIVEEKTVKKGSASESLENIVKQDNQPRTDTISTMNGALKYLRVQGYDEETIQQALQAYEREQYQGKQNSVEEIVRPSLQLTPTISEQKITTYHEQKVSQRLSLEEYIDLQKNYELTNEKIKNIAKRDFNSFVVAGIQMGTGAGFVGGLIYGSMEGLSRGLGISSVVVGFVCGLLYASVGGVMGIPFGFITDFFTTKKRKEAFNTKKEQDLTAATAEWKMIDKKISSYNKNCIKGDLVVIGEKDPCIEYVIEKDVRSITTKNASGKYYIKFQQDIVCVLQPTSERLTYKQVQELPEGTPLLVINKSRNNNLGYGFLKYCLSDYFVLSHKQKEEDSIQDPNIHYSTQDLNDGKITALVLKPERRI